MNECDKNCECNDGCNDENKVVIPLVGPEELVTLVKLVAQIADDYSKAVTGVKKRSTAARKGLMEVKKLTTDMRKMALEKCVAARASE